MKTYEVIKLEDFQLVADLSKPYEAKPKIVANVVLSVRVYKTRFLLKDKLESTFSDTRAVYSTSIIRGTDWKFLTNSSRVMTNKLSYEISLRYEQAMVIQAMKKAT